MGGSLPAARGWTTPESAEPIFSVAGGVWGVVYLREGSEGDEPPQSAGRDAPGRIAREGRGADASRASGGERRGVVGGRGHDGGRR